MAVALGAGILDSAEAGPRGLAGSDPGIPAGWLPGGRGLPGGMVQATMLSQRQATGRFHPECRVKA